MKLLPQDLSISKPTRENKNSHERVWNIIWLLIGHLDRPRLWYWPMTWCKAIPCESISNPSHIWENNMSLYASKPINFVESEYSKGELLWMGCAYFYHYYDQ
jgi:hypothetical protein